MPEKKKTDTTKKAEQILMQVLQGFNTSKPMPENKQTVDKSTGLVKWGKKNDYPYFLIDLYNGSAWHQGIIKGKTHYIAGGGFNDVNGTLSEWIENSPTDFTMDEVFESLAFDQELFGKIYVRGVWNQTGDRVVFWEHIDTEMMRSNKDQTTFWYSDDWSVALTSQSLEKTGFREYPALDMTKREGSFILSYSEPFKRTKGDAGVYGKPGYGGLTAIKTDCEISEYHLKEIENGLKLGTIINFANGIPEEEEGKTEKADAIRKKYSDMTNAGGITITFSEGQEGAPTVLNLNGNDLDKRYLMTEKSVQQNILVGHSVTTPLLFGIKTEGQLSGSSEINIGYEILKNTYVNTKQKRLEGLAKVMIDLSGYEGEIELQDAPPLYNVTEVQQKKKSSKYSDETETGDEERMLNALSTAGRERADLVTFGRTSVTEDGLKNMDNFQEHSVANWFDTVGRITGSLTDFDKSVLQLIDEDNDIMSISKSLDVKVEDVAGAYRRLDALELIKSGRSTSLGSDVVTGLPADTTDFDILYSYEVRDGYGEAIIDTTREFCERVIKLNRLYTRQEIELISSAVDRDVWTYRGGWFNDKGTNTPWCRHEWVQQLIFKN